MKEFRQNISVPIRWTFLRDGQTMQSSMVGRYQAEIYKSHLTVMFYDSHGVLEHRFCGSRAKGMKLANKIISRLLLS